MRWGSCNGYRTKGQGGHRDRRRKRIGAAGIKNGEADQFVGELTDAEAMAVKCDVTNEEQVREWWTRCWKPSAEWPFS